MNFGSDNMAGAPPPILDAIAGAAGGYAASYSDDDMTRSLNTAFSDIFERDVEVFLVSTGTAANALGLAALSPPWGAIYCHREAHVAVDECGACEFFTGGAKLFGLPGDGAKLDAAMVSRALDAHPPHQPHGGTVAAVSITQATECGLVYSPDEVAAIGAVAKQRKIAFHMDGARYANALVANDCHPADITWKAGVDVLSFGATKNGCVAAEAIVVFSRANAEEIGFRRMRAGHLLSKSRFFAAQILAYLRDDLWLKHAEHANLMAARLSAGMVSSARVRLAWETQANEVFAIMPRTTQAALQEAGGVFQDWPGAGPDVNGAGEGEVLVRLVASFATREADVDAFLEALCSVSAT